MQSRIIKYQPAREYYFKEGCFINELSNSVEDPDVSIARVRVEPGKTTKWHNLSGMTERYVILEGLADVEVADIEIQRVGVGDVVSIAPGHRQRIKNSGMNDLVFLAICTPRFVETAYSESP